MHAIVFVFSGYTNYFNMPIYRSLLHVMYRCQQTYIFLTHQYINTLPHPVSSFPWSAFDTNDSSYSNFLEQKTLAQLMRSPILEQFNPHIPSNQLMDWLTNCMQPSTC